MGEQADIYQEREEVPSRLSRIEESEDWGCPVSITLFWREELTRAFAGWVLGVGDRGLLAGEAVLPSWWSVGFSEKSYRQPSSTVLGG